MCTLALVQLPGYWADKLCSAFLSEVSCPRGWVRSRSGSRPSLCVSNSRGYDVASSHRAGAQRQREEEKKIRDAGGTLTPPVNSTSGVPLA